jgi:hypothetical protein
MGNLSKDQTRLGAVLTVAALHDMDDDTKAAIMYTYWISYAGAPGDLARAIAKLPYVEDIHGEAGTTLLK